MRNQRRKRNNDKGTTMLKTLYQVKISKFLPTSIETKNFFFMALPKRNYINKAVRGTQYEGIKIPKDKLELGIYYECNGFSIVMYSYPQSLLMYEIPSYDPQYRG